MPVARRKVAVTVRVAPFALATDHVTFGVGAVAHTPPCSRAFAPFAAAPAMHGVNTVTPLISDAGT